MYYKNNWISGSNDSKIISKNITQLTEPCGSAEHRLRNIKLPVKKLVRNYE